MYEAVLFGLKLQDSGSKLKSLGESQGPYLF